MNRTQLYLILIGAITTSIGASGLYFENDTIAMIKSIYPSIKNEDVVLKQPAKESKPTMEALKRFFGDQKNGSTKSKDTKNYDEYNVLKLNSSITKNNGENND